MSHPAGGSVNDGTEPELCTLRCTSMDEADKLMLQDGQNMQLVKLDVKALMELSQFTQEIGCC